MRFKIGGGGVKIIIIVIKTKKIKTLSFIVKKNEKRIKRKRTDKEITCCM